MPVLKAEGRTFPTTTEVLVIGAGACGTIAALAAKEHGAEAVILERDAKPSGSTSLSSGQIPAAGTKLQRAAGLTDDTPDLLYQDILAKSHGECDRAGTQAPGSVCSTVMRVPWMTGSPTSSMRSAGSGNECMLPRAARRATIRSRSRNGEL